MKVPKIKVVDFRSNCRLGVCFLHLIWFWFYVYLSLVFSACYHWWICLLVGLLSSFLLLLLLIFKIFFPFFTFCECVCVCFCV